MKHSVTLLLVLFGVWLLWSGHFDSPMLISFGFGSSLLIVWLGLRMQVVDEESAPIAYGLRPLRYLPWLVKEIVVTNLDVARRVLSPQMPISPRLIQVRASQKTDLGRVIYANSITLTPGTLTVDMAGNSITVHALSQEFAEDVESGEMDRRVTEMEGQS